ncbi:MAG: hypothetical protein LBM59_02490 [Ruminococcus sp.]|jgi:hypothetical protein|nr:hypothetical protein [Ruminococcus sp.]
MNIADLDTIDKIAAYTKERVLDFRQFQSHKEQVIEDLEPLFGVERDGWKKVTDLGKFRNGFYRVMGKKGMYALKKLLYSIDEAHWKNFDFGSDE